MATSPDVLGAVVAALARVLECDAAGLSAELSLADLGADSLVRVEVAELVENALGGSVRISDELLDEAPTVGALAASFISTTTPSSPGTSSKPSATSTTSIGGDG